MKKEKKQIVLNGSLLRPLSVGRGAILHAGGNIYHTSRVVAILEESEDCVRFETQNSHYAILSYSAPAILKNSAGDSTVTPKSLALDNLLPAFSPQTR